MANLSLKQLRYFQALERTRHFGQAADLCAISQPAMSVQIKNLEAALGVALFDREARDLGLTSFGEDFSKRVTQILRDVDALNDLARAAQREPMGRLRLGVIPTVAPYLLPKLIEPLTRTYPSLDLHVRETMTPRLLKEIHDGKLDAAILALPVSDPLLAETPVFAEPFVLVRPADQAELPVPEPKHLRDMRLLLLEEGHCFRDQALAYCNINAARPTDGLDGSSLSTLVQMVGAGIGVTLLPEIAVSVETRSANVTISELPDPRPERKIGMVWRKTSPLSKHLSDIADVVASTAREIGKAAR